MAGVLQSEKNAELYTPEYLQKAYGLIDQSKVMCQGLALNTPDQARWGIEQVVKFRFPDGSRITRLGVTASWWHCVRAYLTLLQVMLKAGITAEQLQLIPDPSWAGLGADVPDAGMSVEEIVHGEYSRIHAYRKKRDVASRKALIAYAERVHVLVRR